MIRLSIQLLQGGRESIQLLQGGREKRSLISTRESPFLSPSEVVVAIVVRMTYYYYKS